MIEPEETTIGDTATQTHREPHGGAMPHGAVDDIPEHGQVDAHAPVPLGPVDVQAWGAAMLGIALGLIIAVCFVFAASGPRG